MNFRVLIKKKKKNIDTKPNEIKEIDRRKKNTFV